MKLKKFLFAAPAIQKLIAQDLPLRTAWTLSQITRELNERLNFFSVEKQKIISRMAQNKENDDTTAIREVENLLELDVEWDFPPLILNADEPLRLSVSDVDALAGIVDISEEDNHA